MSSIYSDLGAPEVIDLGATLREHYRIHDRLHAADGVDMDAYKEAEADIDRTLEALARKLTPEGVKRLFHLVCELVGDATSPKTPHELHFSADQVEEIRWQVSHLITHLPATRL